MIEKTNINPGEVGDIVVGTVLAPGSQRATECRMAAFYAGFPGDFTISFAPYSIFFLLTSSPETSILILAYGFLLFFCCENKKI